MLALEPERINKHTNTTNQNLLPELENKKSKCHDFETWLVELDDNKRVRYYQYYYVKERTKLGTENEMYSHFALPYIPIHYAMYLSIGKKIEGSGKKLGQQKKIHAILSLNLSRLYMILCNMVDVIHTSSESYTLLPLHFI